MRLPLFLFLICLLSLTHCTRQVADPAACLRTPRAEPPNGVQINDTLFMDRTEISNVDWREYTFWIQQINPRLFPAVLPDTTVWRQQPNAAVLSDIYFRHPAYDDYPVVGISWAQAKAYCAWRADRVYERMLVQRGKIPYTPQQDSTNYFTVARYLRGEFMGQRPDSTVPVPFYRLPSEAEWEMAARGSLDRETYPYGYDFQEAQYLKWAKKRGRAGVFNTLESKFLAEYGRMQTEKPKITAPVASGLPNSFSFFQLIGNVSEMTAVEGVAKGGNYLTAFEQCRIDKRQSHAGPGAALGFRCVCVWKKGG